MIPGKARRLNIIIEADIFDENNANVISIERVFETFSQAWNRIKIYSPFPGRTSSSLIEFRMNNDFRNFEFFAIRAHSKQVNE